MEILDAYAHGYTDATWNYYRNTCKRRKRGRVNMIFKIGIVVSLIGAVVLLIGVFLSWLGIMLM